MQAVSDLCIVITYENLLHISEKLCTFVRFDIYLYIQVIYKFISTRHDARCIYIYIYYIEI